MAAIAIIAITDISIIITLAGWVILMLIMIQMISKG